MAFPKNSCFGQMGHLGPKMVISQLWIRCKDSFTIFYKKKSQERHYSNVFSEKKKSYSGQFGHFGPKMACPHNIGSTLRLF